MYSKIWLTIKNYNQPNLVFANTIWLIIKKYSQPNLVFSNAIQMNIKSISKEIVESDDILDEIFRPDRFFNSKGCNDSDEVLFFLWKMSVENH